MMKRAVPVLVFGVFGVGAAALGGCPIYPASDARTLDRVCVGSDCYDCPNPYYSSACQLHSCTGSADCPDGYACTSDRRCKPTSGPQPDGGTGPLCTKPSDCGAGSTCGADNRCHPGDCSTTGCPATFVCKLSGGAAQCVATSGADGGASTCRSDAECSTPAGSKCLSGSCTAPQDQCADATQCVAGARCVQGACTPSCGTGTPCPSGSSCDGNGVCTGNPTPCSETSPCTGGNVCVEQRCVAPCGPGSTCAAGLVCVAGGCTPDERPIVTCSVDGQRDACPVGSICLRRSCYVTCDADAGADAGACSTTGAFDVCKTVTTSSGPHSVCGSATNLGAECDPTQSKACTSSLVCIDGFCR